MLVVFLAGAALASETPQAVETSVDWRAATARLHLDVPDGFHVAPDAPLRVELDVSGMPWKVETEGLAGAMGLAIPIPRTRPVTLQGDVSVSVCDDAGSSCRVVERTVQGVLDGPRGEGLRLDEVVAAVEEGPHSLDLASALAQAGNGLVLIDFGAVWCPPCNLLAAEVLHDPDDAHLLDGIQLVEVDVDAHDSWSVKDQYQVGGYPTLVAVDGNGAEVARLVGYPGEEAVHSWLAGLPDTEPLSSPPEAASITPEEAGSWALRFVEGQQGDRAGPYFARAAESETPVRAARLATYLLLPEPALAIELADAGVSVQQWGWSALAFVDGTPTLADRIQSDARMALVTASPSDAAGLYYMLASLADEDDAPDLFRAAATTLTAGLSGDLSRDRGHIGFLSRLWEKAGETEQAAEVLRPALELWPDDMTFHEDRAELALRTGDVNTAVSEGALAVKYGHGDNRLRAMKTYAEALHRAGRTAEAVALVREALAETPRPEAGVQVRTPRYLDALAALPFLADPEATP